MGISMRQHLASLVAVFLALLIGVLGGVALTRRPGLDEQIVHVMQQLDQRDQQELTRGRAAEEFGERALPTLVDGKLDGRRVAVFVTATSDTRRARRSLLYALESAGAAVVTRATFDPFFVQYCHQNQGKLMADLELNSAPGDGLLAPVVARKVAQVVVRGDTGAFGSLSRRRFVRIDEEAEGRPSLAIVVGGSKSPDQERLENLDLPLIRYLKSSRAIDSVVGCEASDVHESVMSAYQKEDIPTVDHVDTAVGQYSLVLTLAGAEGNYGIKPSAGRHFPEMPEQP
ncbi:MAG: copper transporter [Armatimonadota bacterium]